MAIEAAVLRASIEAQGVEEAARQLRDFGVAIDNAGRKARDSASGIKPVESAAKGASDGLDQTARSADRAGDQLASAGDQADQAARKVDNLKQSAVAGAAAFVGFKAVDGIMMGMGRALDFVGSAAIGLNSRLEQAEIGFSTMLGSAQKAKSFLEELQQFAARTPFEFPELVTASQKMLAFGFASEQILPLLTAVGDAVAAMGGNAAMIDRVTTAIGQMSAKQRVSAEEMLQLTEAGIPAWQLLAESIDVSVSAVRKMAEQGEISSAQFISAFQEWSTVNVGGMMEEQSKTFQGAMSTIIDSFQMGIAQGAQPFFDSISKGALSISQYLQSDEFSAQIQSISDGFSEFYEMNEGQAKAFIDSLLQTSQALNDFNAALAPFLGLGATSGLTYFFQAWRIELKLIQIPLEGLTHAVRELKAAWDEVEGFVGGLWDRVPGPIKDAAYWTGDLAKQTLGYSDANAELASTFSDLNRESLGWASGFTQNLHTVGASYETVSKQILDSVKEQFKDVESTIGGGIDNLTNRFGGSMLNVVEGVTTMLGPDKLMEAFGGAPDVVVDAMDEIVQAVTDGTVRSSDAIKILSQVPREDLIPALEDAAQKARGGFAQAILEGSDPSGFAENMAVYDQLLDEFGGSLDDVQTKALNFGDIESIMVGAVEGIGEQMDHWEGNVKRIDRAIEILNDRMEEHGSLSAEDQQRLEELNDARARAVGGIHDQEDAYIDAAIALGDYWDTLDSLNQSLSDGQITQEQYNDALQQANENLDPATRMTLDAAGAQRELADSLTESVEKMGALAVLQGSISEEEFNVVFGIDFDDYMTGADEVKQSAEALTSQAWKVAVEADVSGATSTINAFIADRNASGVGFTEGSASATMSSTGDIVLVAAMDTTPADGALGGLRADIDAFDKTFTITAYFDASAVEAGVAHVNRLMPHSPAEEGPLSTLPNWDALFEGMAVSAAKYTGETVDQLKKYVDTSNAILGLIQTAGEVSGSSPVSISNALIGSVTDASSRAISTMGAAASSMDTEFVQDASKWANAASTGFGLISSALDLSDKALGQGGLDMPRLMDLMTDVKFLSEHLMESLAWSAEYLGPQAIQAAETMATGSQKAMELASAALDFIIAFGKGGRPKVALEEVEQFESDVKFLSEHLVESLGWSAEKLGPDLIEKAETMASSAKTGLEVVSSALEMLEAFADYDGGLDLDSVKQFESDVKFLVEHLVESLGWSAAKLDQAAQDGIDLSTSAQAFAEHAGPAIELLNDVLDLLENIGDGEQFEHFDLLRENLGMLAEQTRDIANAMDQAADGWAEEISPAAQTFYDAAGESIGLIGETMDALEAMTGFSADSLDEMNIADVAQSIADVTRAVADAYEQASEDWDDDVNPAIEAFNEAAGGSLELVGDTADVIEAMGDWGKDRAGLNVERIAQQMTADITTIIGTVQGLAEQMDGPGLAAAKAFAESAGPVLGMMGSAGDAFEAMLNRSQITEKDKDRFVDNFEVVIEALMEIHDLLDQEGIQEALAIQDTMETIASILQDAADAIDAVGGGGGSSSGGGGSSSRSRSSGLSSITTINSAFSGGNNANSLTLESVYAPFMSQEPLFNADAYSSDYKYSEYVEQLAMAATDEEVRKVRPTFMGALSLMLGPKMMRLALGPVAWAAEQAVDVIRQRGYASGGYITADQIALLHANEHIVPDQSIPMLADQILAAINDANAPGASPEGALALASAFAGQSYAEPAAGGNPTVSPLPVDALSGRYISDQFHSISTEFDEGTQSVYMATGSYLGSGIDTSWLTRSVLRDMPLHQAYDLLSMIPGFANYVSIDDLEYLRRSAGANSYARFLRGALDDATLSNEEMQALPYSYFRPGALTPELWDEYKESVAEAARFWFSHGAYPESLSPEELEAYLDKVVAEILARPQPEALSPTLPQPPMPPPPPPALPSGPIVNPAPPAPSLNEVFRDGGAGGGTLGTTINVSVYVQDTSPANAALVGQQVSQAIAQRAR